MSFETIINLLNIVIRVIFIGGLLIIGPLYVGLVSCALWMLLKDTIDLYK